MCKSYVVLLLYKIDLLGYTAAMELVLPKTLLILYSCSFPKAIRGLDPISYRGGLLSTLLHAIVYVFTQFAECTSRNCK
jgi:hypothetical protein